MDSQPSQEVTELLKQWEEQHTTPSYDPIPTLTRLAEIIEAETENFMKKDPDPFDERHPSRTDPDCALGHALKVMFKKDNFMTKLVNDYVRDSYYSRLNITGRDVRKLNIAACRLTLDLMPGLEMSVVFQDNEALIHRLSGWAANSVEPLQSYATGLLAAAMEVQDNATGFREVNSWLVPLMLKRLHELRKKTQADGQTSPQVAAGSQTRYFARFAPPKQNGPTDAPPGMPTPKKKGRVKDGGGGGGDAESRLKDSDTEMSEEKQDRSDSGTDVVKSHNATAASPSPEQQSLAVRDGIMSPPPLGFAPRAAISSTNNCSTSVVPHTESSNSSWAEMETYVIGNIQIHPPTDATRQMLILRYLTPMGEYQEFLGHVFEQNALELILAYINVRESRDSRLAFEALKYLAALLCHKKFSIEFINMGGLQRFLEVPRPSVAATGVSICLYYLAYCEDAMERVCLLPRKTLADLVRYALWLLECSHDSGRCHATMFFGLSFQFRVILEEFDNQDGLRKLYNVISTLPILSESEETLFTEDETCAARQIVRHVCVALKRYLEAHLRARAAQLGRAGALSQTQALQQPPYKACKSTAEEIQEQIELVQGAAWTRWPPLDQLVRLGGVTLLLQIVAFAYEWNFNGRAETVRSALDVLSVCCVAPRVLLLLCERLAMPDDELTVGVNVVLGAAEGEIVADPEVQKAALNVLVNCVCAPVHRAGTSTARFSVTGSSKKKTTTRSYEDIIQKVWESVRTNNGIMVLLQLMLIKSPITDADRMRGLACRALAGLARCPTVRQIISKLPLFTTGQIQSLMRDPILQEKRQEHVMFQKYALELLERVSGKSKHTGAEFETSLANIHRANVVAQTQIQYNERELLVLMEAHLASRGLTAAAAALRREAGLPSAPAPAAVPPPVYVGAVPNVTPTRARIHSRTSGSGSTNTTPLSGSHRGLSADGDYAGFNGVQEDNTPSTPVPAVIKIRRCQPPTATTTVPVPSSVSTERRSLQKQISAGGGAEPRISQHASRVTLDSIITEYLYNQHALCKNPMVTCPQFNLFVPHKCPDPRPAAAAGDCANAAARITRRATGLRAPRRLDARLAHSHFCPARTLRLQEDDAYFTTAIFHPVNQTLLAATSSGYVKVFNLFSGQEESSHLFQESYIYHMQASRDGTLLLTSTSATWRPLSALWGLKEFEMRCQFDDEEYVEFSRLSEERVLGTKGETATVFDTTTGRAIVALTPTISNQYTKNRATFNPTDELVLSDGVLWDVSAGKEIHKFDKLNQSLSGVFHPNGLEIISNTEVWDLRTFHLLRTVPTLDKSEVIFNPSCTALYSVCMEHDSEEKSQFESSFRTLDPYDYSSIATIDVKRNIYALCVSGSGAQIALVENLGEYEQVQESAVKLYDVGRKRDVDDDADEDDDEDMGGGSDNDGSDSGSDQDDLALATSLLRNGASWLSDRNDSGDSGSESNESEARAGADRASAPSSDESAAPRPRRRRLAVRGLRSRRRPRAARRPSDIDEDEDDSDPDFSLSDVVEFEFD